MHVPRTVLIKVDRVNRLDLGRWERLLDDDDDIKVWRAINWKSDFDVVDRIGSTRSSDEELNEDFHEVLNLPGITLGHEHGPTTEVSIRVLDDSVSLLGVQSQMKRMKSKKTCGPDGIPPGVLS